MTVACATHPCSRLSLACRLRTSRSRRSFLRSRRAICVRTMWVRVRPVQDASWGSLLSFRGGADDRGAGGGSASDRHLALVASAELDEPLPQLLLP